MTHLHMLVLEQLKSGPKTKAQLRKSVGVDNPGDSILKLRKSGHKILTEMVESTNRYGRTIMIGRYAYRGRD